MPAWIQRNTLTRSAQGNAKKVNLSIVAQGRLDNRAELAELLDIAHSTFSSLPDSEIILAVYQKFGIKTPEYLLGDFAFAICDAQNEWVFCARDHMGIVPFFFFLDNATFVFSSEISSLVSCAAVPDNLCQEAIAVYLRYGDLRHDRLTFFDRVKKLPAAHALIVGASFVKEWKYWHPEDSAPVRLPNLQAYSDKLRHVLEQAVLCRLPANNGLAVHLSGGLDSSAIAALASIAMSKSGQSITGYSWLSDPRGDSELTNPEWAPGVAVARQYDIPIRYSDFGIEQMVGVLESFNIASGDTVDCWYELNVRRSACSDRCPVILSGWGGDELITHYGNQRYVETFLSGRLISTFRDIWQATAQSDSRISDFLGIVYGDILQPMFAGGPKSGSDDELGYLGAATGDFLEYTKTLDLRGSPVQRFSVRDSQLAYLRMGHLLTRVESWAVAARGMGVEYRYPMLDKRVVEFALGLPPDMYRKKGHPRYLFRHMVKDFLPEEVWASVNKYEKNRVETVLRVYKDALASWRVSHLHKQSENPFIDVARLGALLDKIGASDPAAEKAYVMDVNTAVRSILVLNISANLAR